METNSNIPTGEPPGASTTSVTPPGASTTSAEQAGRQLPESPRLGTFANACLALAGLAVAFAALWWTINPRKDVETVRVEIGTVSSNSNKLDYAHPWESWQASLPGGSTTYVGVRRKVRFSKSFLNSPTVLSALSLIDVRPLDAVPKGLDFLNSTEQQRFSRVNAVTFVDSPTSEDFYIKVGLSLPAASANYLIKHLYDAVDSQVLSDVRTAGMIEDRKDEPNKNEKWTVNFYTKVGSIDVMWVAGAVQK